MRRPGSLQAEVMVLVTVLAGFVAARAGETGSPVERLRLPHGGIQPQAVGDGRGGFHLVYFRGDPAAGNLEYARSEPGTGRLSDPVRVDPRPGSAVALGTIRGAQIALGAEGRAHIVWNGSKAARPRNPIEGAPLLYTRSDEAGTAFEPPRNLMRRTFGLDGGGTVAADGAGNVWAAWHGRAPGDPDGEPGRRLWVARSTDGGATFSEEIPALDRPTGACACCGTRALADRRGALRLIFRAAAEGVHRDALLLTSIDGGRDFQVRLLEPWTLNACPMTLPALAEAGPTVLAAWETRGQVAYARIDAATGSVGPIVHAPGPAGGRKHPAIAGNARGEVLLAWAEGTDWQKGGDLAWQRFDRDGRPVGETRRIAEGIPAWSLPAVVARPDGDFVLLH